MTGASLSPGVPGGAQQGLSLHALVLKLIALDDGVLPGTMGELAHAAFYATVQAADPALAAQIHDAQERKAFSLSPLYGYWESPQDHQIHVRSGQEGWLRVSLLDDRLFAVFVRHLLLDGPAQRTALRLGRIRFAVTEALGNPGSHPWVGYTTLEALAALDAAPERWVLDFASPTAIRWGDADNGVRRVELFPLPRMAIAGLRKRWDDWTGQQWGRPFEEWVERNVAIGRIWRWETQTFPYRKQQYQGGLGRLEYHLLDTRDREQATHLNRLLALAFYTGIGYKTTHGLGQVRIVTG